MSIGKKQTEINKKKTSIEIVYDNIYYNYIEDEGQRKIKFAIINIIALLLFIFIFCFTML